MIASPAVHLDVTELVAKPLRTGIQRVEREAIRHWPGPARLVPCRVNADGQVLALPPAALELLCAEDQDGLHGRAAEPNAFANLSKTGRVLRPDEIKRLLNLELFFDEARADAHLRLAAAGTRVLWYVYDFLPFLRPDLFAAGTIRHCMHYLRALRGVGDRLAFLSEQTRREYIERIARLPTRVPCWPVIGLGADALQLERQAFSPDRRDFVSVGTIEPRKNPEALLRAFELLWERGLHVRLVMIGRISPDAHEAKAFFARHAENVRLRVMGPASDAALRTALRLARAVVMPSEAEGFGLPPYEALQSGIPAIASKRLPSAAMMPQGVVLLDRMDPRSLADAVESLLDDAAAARLWSAAAGVRLPTWADFGAELGAWAQQT